MTEQRDGAYAVPESDDYVSHLQCAHCDSPVFHRIEYMDICRGGWRWILEPHRKTNGDWCIQAYGAFQSWGGWE